MIRIAIVASLLATPAQACHRFHTWNYPWPQRCAVNAPNVWSVEIIKPPPLDDREIAIEKLKKLLEARQ